MVHFSKQAGYWDDFWSNVEKQKEWLAQYVSDYLNSNEFVNWVEDKMEPFVKSQLADFFEQNKDKIQEYQNDPSKLQEDFRNFADIFNAVDYVLMAIDIAVIIKLIIDAIAAIPSGGASLASAAATFGIKSMIKQGLRRTAKTVTRRLIDKLSIKMLKKYAKKYGTSLATKFSTSLLREIKWRLQSYIFLRSIYSVVEVGAQATLIAAKHYIAEQGDQLQISRDLIRQATAKETTKDSFLQIINNEMQDIGSYIKKIISTKEGLKDLGLMTLARMVGINGVVMRRLHINRLKSFTSKVESGELRRFTNQRGFSSQHDKLIEQELNRSAIPDQYHDQYAEVLQNSIQGSENSQQIIRSYINKAEETLSFADQSLSQTLIPETLHNQYLEMFTGIVAENLTKDPKSAIEKRLGQAEQAVFSAIELIKETVIIDFLAFRQQEMLKSQNQDALDQLLDEVTNVETTNVYSLMNEYGVDSFQDLLNTLKEQKSVQLTGILSRIALGSKDPDLLLGIQQSLREQSNLDDFRSNLETLVFGD